MSVKHLRQEIWFDDKAVELANGVLEKYPDNEIALECVAIAREQQGESAEEEETES